MNSSSDRSADLILKILSGTQAGIDVALASGDYTLGSDDDDDIRILDVSLKPGHARLRVSGDRIEIAGAAGRLTSRNGLEFEPGGPAQAVEPLDIVCAGTSRFAFGPRSANWASVADAEGDAPLTGHAPSARERRGTARPFTFVTVAPWRTAGLSALLAGLVLGAGLLLSVGGLERAAPAYSAHDEYETIRLALSRFDFRDRISVEKALDDTIFVTGFVDEPVERRAVLAAVRETGIPARVRVGVLELIRHEAEDILATEKSDLRFTLSQGGVLNVSGVILDPRRSEVLRSNLLDRLAVLSALEWEVRSAADLLAEIGGLAERARIAPLVLFRLDGGLVEATGLLPADKIDPWVGFLQSYSSQFAGYLPLRSFVQLQHGGDAPSAPPQSDRALVIGEPVRAGDVVIDVERLRQGDYSVSDVFVRGREQAEPVAQDEPEGNAAAQDQQRLDLGGILRRGRDGSAAAGGDAGGLPDRRPAAPEGGSWSNGGSLSDGDSVEKADAGGGIGTDTDGEGGDGASRRYNNMGQRIVGSTGEWTPEPEAGGVEHSGGEAAARETTVDLGALGRQLLRLWESGRLGDGDGSRQLRLGMDLLGERWAGTGEPQSIVRRYEPLLANPRPFSEVDRQCRGGGKLTEKNVSGALFWLDLLSVSSELSITDLEPDAQHLLLEAALNPKVTEECASAALGRAVQSVYLFEIARNASFVGHLVRDYDRFALDIVGASILDDRYVQTSTGRKLREGAAPVEASRLLVIGQLGIVVQRSSGYAAQIFSDLDWIAH